MIVDMLSVGQTKEIHFTVVVFLCTNNSSKRQ